jgi:hypothetical protein
MSVDETLMCSFKKLKPNTTKKLFSTPGGTGASIG